MKFKWNALVLLLLCALFMTSCSFVSTEEAEETEETEEEEEPEEEAQEEEEEEAEEAEADASLIEMEAGSAETVTKSGVEVERKNQNYKVIQGVNVRDDCDGSSNMIGTLFTGNIVQGTGVCENGWIQINFNGETGYSTGSCFEETDEEANTGVDASETAQNAEEEAEEQAEETPAENVDSDVVEEALGTEEGTVYDVTDWAKYTSSTWECDNEEQSCYLQIYSVAGNEVVFSMRVIDGSLEDDEATSADITNCSGKITDGYLNFGFTDSFDNIGVGRMEIVDDEHLQISTAVTYEEPNAKYQAVIDCQVQELS